MTIQARSHLLIPDDIKHKRALIVGAGTVGSNVAMGLASIGVRNFTIVDYDTVGVHNIPSQVFDWDQIGYGKADCLSVNLCNRFGLDAMNTKVVNGKFTPGFEGKGGYDIIVSAADSMTVRKMVAMWSRGQSLRLIDTRCAGHEIQTWAIDTEDPEQVEAYMSTIHPDSEASPLPCGGEMYPAAGLAATLNTLAAISTSGYFYRLADTELSAIAVG